jgi:nicotinate-nucleotide adenylyltransferase
MRLGLFGGTFDPVHLAHLAIAETARERLGLDRVVFIPAGAPPHKAGQAVSPAADRLEMVRAAVADNPSFACSDVELLRPGPSYAADTLGAFAQAHPGAELFWLLGSDSVTELHTWRAPDRLFRLATFVGLARPGWPEAQVRAWLAAQPPGMRPRLEFVDVPLLEISASEVRRRAAAGESVRYLVPDPVRAYLLAHGLYRPEGSGGHA